MWGPLDRFLVQIRRKKSFFVLQIFPFSFFYTEKNLFTFIYLGQIPGKPQGGRHGMIFGHISNPSTIGNSNQPLVPGRAPLVF